MKSVTSIVLVFVIGLTLLETVTCTPQAHKAADGTEYLIEAEPKYNWYQASNECARQNSHLVVIDTAEKNTALIDLLKKVVGRSHNLWLGGNDEYSTSQDFKRPFFWSPTGKEFTFTFWSDKNPDNFAKREHCVHIWDEKPLYQWNDVECERKMGFICERNQNVEKCSKNHNSIIVLLQTLRLRDIDL